MLTTTKVFGIMGLRTDGKRVFVQSDVTVTNDPSKAVRLSLVEARALKRAIQLEILNLHDNGQQVLTSVDFFVVDLNGD